MSKWCIVQHSAFGYQGNPQFQQGLETRMIRTAGAVGKVENAGGVLFNSYKEAEDFCEHAMYPPGSEPLNAPFMASLIPNAQGHFSPHTIDNLRIYIPVRETRVVG